MPKKGENISLTSYDDLFETDESRAESQLERVQNIPVRELTGRIERISCSLPDPSSTLFHVRPLDGT